MLSKNESKVMSVIYNQCTSRKALLIEPENLLALLDVNLSLDKIDKIVNDLNTDGYFDLVYTERHGQKVYCIVLTEKGKAFKRNSKIIKRNLIYKLIITLVFAVISFIIGVVLRAVF